MTLLLYTSYTNSQELNVEALTLEMANLCKATDLAKFLQLPPSRYTKNSMIWTVIGINTRIKWFVVRHPTPEKSS